MNAIHEIATAGALIQRTYRSDRESGKRLETKGALQRPALRIKGLKEEFAKMEFTFDPLIDFPRDI